MTEAFLNLIDDQVLWLAPFLAFAIVFFHWKLGRHQSSRLETSVKTLPAVPAIGAEARQRAIDHMQATTLEHMRAIEAGAKCCAFYADELVAAVRAQGPSEAEVEAGAKAASLHWWGHTNLAAIEEDEAGDWTTMIRAALRAAHEAVEAE